MSHFEVEKIIDALSNNLIIVSFTVDGLIKSCNKEFSEKIGISPEYLVNENINNLFLVKEQNNFFNSLINSFHSKNKSTSNEYQVNSRHDRVFWIYAVFIPVHDKNEELDEILMVGLDITESKSQEERVRILEFASGLGTWDWHLHTNKVNYDKRWCEMLGYQVADLDHSYMTWAALIHPEDKDYAIDSIKNYLNGETAKYEVKYRFKHKAGHYVWILSKGKMVEYDENNQPLRFSGTHMDYTDMKKLEDKLEEERSKSLHAAKFAALGEMAGGLAHEINTPLATIGLACDLISGELNQAEIDLNSISENLSVISQTVSRVSEIIRGLREFSRNDNNITLLPVPLETIIEETLSLCQEKLKAHGFEIILDFKDNIFLNVNKVQMVQVFLNLINNSYDALNDLDLERWIKLEAEVFEDFIQIQYTDSGKGIPQKVLEKMFQPFFTTKPVGKGTGLGMSISHGIIESFNGRLRYKEKNGHTGFEILLPTGPKWAIFEHYTQSD